MPLVKTTRTSLPYIARRGVVAAGLVVAIFTISPSGLQAQRAETSVKEQLAFGVDMAKRGLWSEALFRFRQAERLEPNNPSVYNNLAVAHEAIGLFEEALQLYRKGLEINPRDKGLRNNYARFIDFYNRFKPDDDESNGGGAASSEALADGAEQPATEPPKADPTLSTADTPTSSARPSHSADTNDDRNKRG